MFGQVQPSKPRPPGETAQSRLALFEGCLRRMQDALPPGAPVAFPHRIGCGLAGGSWPEYLQRIERFAADRPVVIVELPGGR